MTLLVWNMQSMHKIRWYRVEWRLSATYHSFLKGDSHISLLIINIFTNNIGDINSSVKKLFIAHITDHFPLFHIAKQMEINENDAYIR